MQPIQTISRELLELETVARAQAFTTEQRKAWHELLTQWLEHQRSADDKRRFLRFPCDAEIRLRCGEEVIVAKLVEVGNFGVQVRGDLGKTCRRGESVVWDAVRVDGVWMELGVACEVVRKTGRWSAGLRVDGSASSAQRIIYQSVYYPAYLDQLSQLAQSAQA